MRTKSKKQTYNYCLNVIIISLLLIINISCQAQKNLNTAIIADGAQLTLVADGFEFTEGPAADKEGNVYFTDQPNDRILKWNAIDNTVSDYMKPSGRSNGLYFDNQGNLLAIADEQNEIWSIDVDKKVTVLLANFEGKKFNGPNDLWVDNKGGVYFTDPYYQRSWWEHKEDQQKYRRIYYITPNSTSVRIVADDNFIQPNGIIGSPDGKTLYIADIGADKTFAYQINDEGTLSNKKLFVNKGSDGMTLDNMGNVYLTGNGVTVFNSEGKQIEKIEVPQDWTSNVTFGGKNQNILFITALNSAYTLNMNVSGERY
ncbi:SMP-30/gluconolactonase/LRE family protein [Gelidibacter salicanalis]|uniref:SMP-30/gluconolactonase/LRE family protein n=1 Tax=Gelidibacter salicanalis TaxID=291193 RepID=A0A934KUW4_9FLAO|nr:SMP-30/gluconolactonase/LRE family protein [Gelidibacter salicanalis]MBJ7880673.1 SMP-30/gluconolactonase/LRE family protein [Gelidibacter salicanalis]